MGENKFPRGFLWGAATSSQQIEGATREDGRGKSIWDTFAAIEGNIEDGSTPEVACDHYHRWREDIDLMSGLNLGAYRFSIAWPRVLPNGSGQVNSTGLDFYDALVDKLLEAGIQPFPTLYHWDLPQSLQDQGGWASREIIARFVEYSQAVTRRLGDRVQNWVTHNEPWCIATLGHEEGCHAPGHKNPTESLAVAHHLLLSHGHAVQSIRQEVPGAQVGIVNIHCPAHPLTLSPDDLNAARWFDGFFNRWYLDPIFKGKYPEDVIEDRRAAGHLTSGELPFVKDGDMAIISTHLDFLGLNYYSRSVQQKGPDGNPLPHIPVPENELTDMGWEVFPEGLYDSLKRVHHDYNPPQIYIMENGAAYDDPISPDGSIKDDRRITYYQQHLLAAQRALLEGVPLKGYFAWSLLDNFEWGLGFAKKFGLFAMDKTTGNRIPKNSAYWYGNVAATNTVDAPHL